MVDSIESLFQILPGERAHCEIGKRVAHVQHCEIGEMLETARTERPREFRFRQTKYGHIGEAVDGFVSRSYVELVVPLIIQHAFLEAKQFSQLHF